MTKNPRETDANENNTIIYPCANCGSEITKLNDDSPKQKFCNSCLNPKVNHIERRRVLMRLRNEKEPKLVKITLPTAIQLAFSKLNLELFCDKDGHFKPSICARIIYQTAKFQFDRKTEQFYYYDEIEKVWKKNAEIFIKEILGIILPEDNNKHIFNNVVHCLQSISMENVTFSKKKISLKNGLFDPVTQELTDFDPEVMTFFHVNVEYDPEAKCPKFLEYVNQVCPEDQISLLQEWTGFQFLPDYRFHKIMWIYGKGRNGKGVWARTIEALLVEDHVSSVGIEEFEGNHRFSQALLYGKLANICSEPPTKKVLNTIILKRITGQDTIDAEIKGKQKRLKFRNCAKFTVMGNEFPRVRDRTVAFRDRTIFLKFPNEFTGEKQIQNIEKQWIDDPEEMSGVFNWALEGLQRLLKKGMFTQTKSQDEIQAEFLRASDSIGAWLNDATTIDRKQNLVTDRAKAYDHYKNYCEIFGLNHETKPKFTQRLRDTKGILDKRTRVQGKLDRYWFGLGLKNLSEMENVTDVTDVTSSIYSHNTQSTLIGKEENNVTSVQSVTLPKKISITKHPPGSFCEDCEGNEPIFAKEYSFSLPDNPLFKSGNYDVCENCLKKMKEGLKPDFDLVIQQPKEEIS